MYLGTVQLVIKFYISKKWLKTGLIFKKNAVTTLPVYW